ncbi:MAG: hypothetical protein ROO73_01000 [Roseivirga sp.]
MIDKDKTIIDFLQKVRSKPDFATVEIVDYWDGDLCATGLRKNDRLVYISTYGFCKQNIRDDSETEYDCDFEMLDKKNLATLRVVKEIKTKDKEYLFKEIKRFLGV